MVGTPGTGGGHTNVIPFSITLPANTAAEITMVAIPMTLVNQVFFVRAEMGCYGAGATGNSMWEGVLAGYLGGSTSYLDILDYSSSAGVVTCSMNIGAQLVNIACKNNVGSVKFCYGDVIIDE